MIRACIFDLGGTIVDKYSLTPFNALRKAFLTYNLSIRNNLIYKDMGLDKKEHIHKILSDPYISRDFMIQYNKNPDMEDTEMIFDEFNKIQVNYSKKINIIPETKDIIDYLRNKDILIGVTTGFNKEITEIIINELDKNNIKIDKFVSSSCLSSPGRPYPHMINHLMNEFKLTNPYNIIKLDDTVVGINEGKMADTWSVGVIRWSINMKMSTIDEYNTLNLSEKGKKLKECQEILMTGKPDYILNTLNELPEIIERIKLQDGLVNLRNKLI